MLCELHPHLFRKKHGYPFPFWTSFGHRISDDLILEIIFPINILWNKDNSILFGSFEHILKYADYDVKYS
jgi:hypothetical protein